MSRSAQDPWCIRNFIPIAAVGCIAFWIGLAVGFFGYMGWL